MSLTLHGKPIATLDYLPGIVACLARFADVRGVQTYCPGVMWVGVDASGRVVWTEGVRKASGSDAADVDGMWPQWRDLYDRTMAARTGFAALPTLA